LSIRSTFGGPPLTAKTQVIRVPGDGLQRVDETKSAAGRRTIPLPRFAIETSRTAACCPTSASGH
jgi:hypothetical protein